MNNFPDNKILIATHNNGKLEEFKQILKDLDLLILSSKDLNLDEPQETEDTFIGNARLKSREHSHGFPTKVPIIVPGQSAALPD